MRPLPKAVICFAAATAITWFFIRQGGLLYRNERLMLTSCAIAGGKWGLQVVAALCWLGEKRWDFIGRISSVCLAGSVALLPYAVFSSVRDWPHSFLISLIVAVVLMVCLYYNAVRSEKIAVRWFFGWIVCLLIAISLQLFVVFSIAG